MTESSCQGPPLLSIIVPLLNERALLPAVLPTILRLQQSHGAVEWLFVDGGSGDGSVEYLQAQGLRVIASDAGRARQMNAGAAQAIGACHTTRLGQTSQHAMGPAATWPSFPSAGRGLAFLAW